MKFLSGSPLAHIVTTNVISSKTEARHRPTARCCQVLPRCCCPRCYQLVAVGVVHVVECGVLPGVVHVGHSQAVKIGLAIANTQRSS
jgi:hypothetical protein